MAMCFAPDCKHYSEKHVCRFFRFPKHPKDKKKWISLLRRKDREPSKHSVVCSCHFKDGERKNGPTMFEHNKSKRFYDETCTSIGITKPKKLMKQIHETVVAEVASIEAKNYFLGKELEKREEELKKLYDSNIVCDQHKAKMIYQKRTDISKISPVVVLKKNLQGTTAITDVPQAINVSQKGTELSKKCPIVVLERNVPDNTRISYISKVSTVGQERTDTSKMSAVVVHKKIVQDSVGSEISNVSSVGQKGTDNSKIFPTEVLKKNFQDSTSTTDIPKVNISTKEKYFYHRKTDISNMCRVCLTQSPKTMYDLTDVIEVITGSCSNKVSIIEALQTVTSTTIVINPKYPQYICPICLSMLKMAYRFILNFKESQMQLEKTVGLVDDIDNEMTVTLNIEETEINMEQNKIELLTDDNMDIEECEIKCSPLSEFESEITDSEAHGKLEVSTLEEDIDSDKHLEKEGKEVDDNWKSGKVELIIEEEEFDTSDINDVEDEECEAEFDGSLINNASPIDSVVDKMFSCKRCDRSYDSNQELKEHMASHLVEKKFLCNFCGERFYQQNGLSRHMILHTYGRRYQCPYCAKLFSMDSKLQHHVLTHTGVIHFKCKFCDEEFSSKSELSVHESVHTGFNPYVCRFCRKGFTLANDLKLHLFQHRGLYSCNICDKNFIDERILQMHYKQTHGTTLPDIDTSYWKLSDYCEEAADLENNSELPSEPLKPKKCCVPNCVESRGKRHRFPKPNRELFDLWLERIKPHNYQQLSREQIYNRYYVCDQHFAPDCFLPGSRKGLMWNAVPSLHIPKIQDSHWFSVLPVTSRVG